MFGRELVRQDTPTPLFLAKSLESLEKKRVVILTSAKEFASY